MEGTTAAKRSEEGAVNFPMDVEHGCKWEVDNFNFP